METKDFQLGDRVKGKHYDDSFTGTVRSIGRSVVEVERDDDKRGGGSEHDDTTLWRCSLRDGDIRSDGRSGEPLVLINSHGGDKMRLSEIKKPNLAEAKKQFDVDKKSAEIDHAKAELMRATNEIDRLDRQIKSYEDEKKPYLEILEKFK